MPALKYFSYLKLVEDRWHQLLLGHHKFTVRIIVIDRASKIRKSISIFRMNFFNLILFRVGLDYKDQGGRP